MKRTGKIRRFLALAAAAALALTACGPKAAAATMHLRRAEGAVAVADGAGRPGRRRPRGPEIGRAHV